MAANTAESPVYALLHEVATVGGGGFDEGEAFAEVLVGALLVVAGEAGEQGEGGAFLELTGFGALLMYLGPGVGCAVV